MNRLSMPQTARSATLGILTLALHVTACSDRVVDPQDGPAVRLEIEGSTEEFGSDVIAGQYVVKFRGFELDDVAAVAEQIVRDQGGSLRFVYGHAIQGFSASLPSAGVEAIQGDPRVALVSPNRQYRIGGDRTVQEDPPWGLDRIDQRDLPLDGVYVYGPTGGGVTAYIIDSGIRFTHEEFEGPGGTTRAEFGFDAIGDGQNGADCNGHGTHVAGTLGGVTYGVAKEVTLVSVRVADCEGDTAVELIVAGVDWVSANHVHPAVANMSIWGPPDSVLDAAVVNSIQNGIFYSLIAGNAQGQDACNFSPGRVEQGMTAAASNSSDSRWDGSNIGPCVDLFAPGESILSAWWTSDTATRIDSGTSMAAPHVAGIAALYREVDPVASPPVVADTILSWATPDRLSNVGSGSPNLLAYSNPPPPAPPESVTISGPLEIQPDATCTWDAVVFGGDPPFDYLWTGEIDPWGTTDPSYTGGKDSGVIGDQFKIRVEVSNAGGLVTDEITVTEDPNAPICLM